MDRNKKIGYNDLFVINAESMRRLVYLSNLLNADTVKIEGALYDWKTIMNELVADTVTLDDMSQRSTSVLQQWVAKLPYMQQSVLLTAVRGPDGREKYDPPKMLLRWFRRCFLVSAFDGEALTNPYDMRGGSFTGPSVPSTGEMKYRGLTEMMKQHTDAYIQSLDAIPGHFQRHFMHAVEILGYKHPDEDIRAFWLGLYHRLVSEMHLMPETEEQLDARLCDKREGWLARSDEATRS